MLHLELFQKILKKTPILASYDMLLRSACVAGDGADRLGAVSQQHLWRLGAELGLSTGFDATRLLGKLSCGKRVSLGLPRSTLEFNGFALMSLLS